MCKPPRLPVEVFSKLHFLPDPILNTNGHYKPFQEVYGTCTTEEFRPSLQKRSSRGKALPFSASIQHVRNVGIMVQCEECEMWHLIYSRHKLSTQEKKQLEQCLNDYTFTCGATLADLNLPGNLSEVCVRDLRCYDNVEKLYYSMKNYEPVCIHCCAKDNLSTEANCYPQCHDCTTSNKPPVKKRT